MAVQLLAARPLLSTRQPQRGRKAIGGVEAIVLPGHRRDDGAVVAVTRRRRAAGAGRRIGIGRTGRQAGRSPDQFGSLNAPYTYPDCNSAFLAAVKAKDGSVLIPSYVRVGPNGNVVSLRPDARYHTNFPPQADASGDVRNLADGAWSAWTASPIRGG